jgi:hypothetical protein
VIKIATTLKKSTNKVYLISGDKNLSMKTNLCWEAKAMSANVWRLCEGVEIEAQMLKLAQMFNRITNVQISTKAPLLQNRCYLHVALFISILFSILDKI